MNLAILHPFQFRYARGIERFTWSLSEALTRRAVNVDLYTWRWPNPISWGAIPPGLRIFQMPNLRYFREKMAALWYFAQLSTRRYDWIMVYFAGYGESEAIRWLRKKNPCVVFHFPRQQVPHRFAEFERGGLARNAGERVAVSDHVANDVTAHFGRACVVIPNGVNAEAFKPSPERRAVARQKLGIAPETPVLISLSALEERKGIQSVVRAMPHLLAQYPDLQYRVLGEGAYRSELEAEIRRLDLGAHVHLMGNQSEVADHLAAADVGCQLAYGEALPVAVLEMLAMELPVLTSQHPPFDSFIRPEWGMRVQESDTQAVADAICALLEPTRRSTMGRAGREHVITHYSWESVADAYLRLLWQR